MVVPILGGFAGTLLITAGMYLAPLVGFPFIDIPHLMGGVLTSNEAVALWIGLWLHFIAGTLVFPMLFNLFWPSLRGPAMGIVGCATKGVQWGIALWILSGLLMPVGGWLNRLDPTVLLAPGFFALGFGWKGAAALLVGHIVYGLALGLVCYMAADIFPLETLGWGGYLKAELPPYGRLYQEPGFAEHPPLGSR